MDQLKTATGKVFDCDYFNPYPRANRLYIRVLQSNLVTVAQVFGNPAETIQLWCGEQYIANYTVLMSISPEGNAIRVVLGKE